MASPRNFFDAQAHNRRSVGWLVALLAVAVAALLVGLYAVGLLIALPTVSKEPLERTEFRRNAAGETVFSQINRVTGEVVTTTIPDNHADSDVPEAFQVKRKAVTTRTYIPPEIPPPDPWRFWRWDPTVCFWTVGLGAVVIAIGCRLRFKELDRGGDFLAISLGARLVPRGTADLKLRQYLNVVEEMALASAVPSPKCYVLEGDSSVNAFIAGRQDDVVLGVTRGALDQLTRDELQALVAHEFSLIDREDLRLNLAIVGLLAGLLVLTKLGYLLLRQAIPATFSKEFHRAWFFFAAGGAVVAAGFAGAYFARTIQAAVARKRTLRADAAALQYTRYPGPLLAVLRKAEASSALVVERRPPRDRFEVESQSELDAAMYERMESQHLFFHSVPSAWDNVVSTHPKFAQRIAQLERMA